VTNTSVGDGHIQHIDERYFWRTTVHKETPCSTDHCSDAFDPATPEENDYHTARINAEARFQDGTYQVHILLADLIHPLQEAANTKVVLDNFLPYVEDVEVIQDGNTIYQAGWIVDNAQQRLEFGYYALPEQPPPGAQVAFRLTASEVLRDLNLDLDGQSVPLMSSDGLEWTGTATLPTAARETYALTITGHDLANNALLAFDDATATPISERTGHAPPDPEWTPIPALGADTVHRLGADLIRPALILPCHEPDGDGLCVTALTDLPAWAVSPPDAQVCQTSHGGVACRFDEDRAGVSLSVSQGGFLWPVTEDALHGTYFLPGSGSFGLDIRWKAPPGDFREPTESIWEGLCPGSLGYNPERDDPPHPETLTESAEWSIISEETPANDRCRIRVDLDPGTLSIDLQPHSLCAGLPAEETGVLDMAATYEWGPLSCFNIPESTLEKWKQDGMPEGLVNSVASLSGVESGCTTAETFWAELEALVGAATLEAYRNMISRDIMFAWSNTIPYTDFWPDERDEQVTEDVHFPDWNRILPPDPLQPLTHPDQGHPSSHRDYHKVRYVYENCRQEAGVPGYTCDVRVQQVRWIWVNTCLYREGRTVSVPPDLDRQWTLRP
jgi:hypothetical protein